MNLHGNTVDGLHVASAGGVWSALVFGFGGMRDRGGKLSFDPRLPDDWPSMRFPLTLARLPAAGRLTQDELAIDVGARSARPEVRLTVRGEEYVVTADSPLRVPLDAPGRPDRRAARRQAHPRRHPRRRHQDHRRRPRADRVRGPRPASGSPATCSTLGPHVPQS